MDVEQLLHRYAEGQRDFSWVDLRRADLRGASLSDASFYRADLTGTLLDGANLRRVSFLKANLMKADLSNADLTGANLKRADLTGTIFTGAVLDAVTFSDITLPGGLPAVSAAMRQQASQSQTQVRRSQVNPQEDLRDGLIKGSAVRSPLSSKAGVGSHSPHSEASERSMRRLASFSRSPSPPITEIPLPSLALLWAGYCCFGSILGIFDASGLLWVTVWATALIWMLGESMAWFIPILAAIAVMLGSGLSLWSVFMAGSVSLGLMLGLLMLNWSIPKALKDSLWIGGIVAVLVNLGLWLVNGEQGRVVISGYFPLVFLLLIGMGSSGMGAIAWLQMRSDGFHRHQIAWTFAGFAALGLFSGGAISSLVMPSA